MKKTVPFLKKDQKPSVPLNVLQNYLNFVHIIFLCPFAVRFNSEKKLLYTETKRWRKIVAGSIQATTFFVIVLKGLTTNAYNVYQSTTEAWFRSVSAKLMSIFLAVVFYMFWFQKENIVAFLNQLCAACDSISSNISTSTIVGNRIGTTLSVILPVIVIFFSLVNLIKYDFDDFGITSERGVDHRVTQNILIDRVRSIYFHESVYNESAKVVRFTSIDYGLTVTYIIFKTYAYCLLFSGYVLCLGVTWVFWILVRVLIKTIKETTPTNANLIQILDTFDNLCVAFDYSEECFGLLYCLICLGLVPIYAIQLPDYFRSKILARGQVAAYTLLFYFTIFPAAHINSMIKIFPSWIQYSYGKAPTNGFDDSRLNTRVNVIIQKINSNGIGLSGKLFMITYGFIGNTWTAIITYSIIMLQFKFENEGLRLN